MIAFDRFVLWFVLVMLVVLVVLMLFHVDLYAWIGFTPN
jgi:hypothetical protein